MKHKTTSLKLALASGVALSLVSGAGAAADLTRSFAVGVNGCDAAVQLCTPVPTVALPTAGVLRVEFDAATTHCSSIIAHLLVDGVEQFAPAHSPRERARESRTSARSRPVSTR